MHEAQRGLRGREQYPFAWHLVWQYIFLGSSFSNSVESLKSLAEASRGLNPRHL